MINAGMLNRKVTILKPVESKSNYGATTIKYEPAISVWATIKPVRGQQYYLMDRAENRRYATITIRYRQNINESYKIRYQSIDYGIDSVVDPNEKHESLELYCSVDFKGGRVPDNKNGGEKHGSGLRFSGSCRL